jgi:hypothetical protein
MRAKTFRKALDRFTSDEFTPFVVELLSGARMVVSHPEAIRLEDGLITIVDSDFTVHLFDDSVVSQLFVPFGRSEDRPESGLS